MRIREKVPRLHLAVFILLSATVSALDGSREKRESTASTTECSVGMVERRIDEIRWLTNGGTYLLQPPLECSGRLVSLDACFRYNSRNQVPDIFTMEVGVYKLNSSTNEYQNRNLTPLIQLMSLPTADENQRCTLFNMTFDPLLVEIGDMIGVLVPRSCRNRPDGRIGCPLQPNFLSELTDRRCSVIYFDRLGTRKISISDTTISTDCINLKASVVGTTVTTTRSLSPTTPSSAFLPLATSTADPNTDNSTENPQSEEKELSNGLIVGIAIGGATFVAIIVIVVVSLFLYCKKYLKRQKQASVPGLPRARENNPSTLYQSTDGEGVRPRVSRESSLRLTPSFESSYRRTFSNRAYSSCNQYANTTVAVSNINRNGNGNSVDSPQPLSSTPHEYQTSGQYECASDYGDPYWVPASREGELRAQLLDLDVPEVPRGEIEIYEELGSGNFGMVHRGLWASSQHRTEVALKCLLTSSTEGERVKFLQEAAIMGQFKHPNILNILGMVTISEPLMILSELMCKGDLHHYLKSLQRPSPDMVTPMDLPALLLSFCRQVASGMTYLAHKSYVHRDVAARNILVSDDNICKIADFGLSRDLQDSEVYISSGGKIPVKWTAPEALTFRKYSTASDVWSYGILLYEIWALGTKPYQNNSNREALQMVLSGYRLPPPPGCPRSVYQLMIQCWHPEAASRPTFFDTLLALQRPDFQVLKWTCEEVAAYSKEARTIGSPIEAGQELYTDIQHVYVSQNQ